MGEGEVLHEGWERESFCTRDGRGRVFAQGMVEGVVSHEGWERESFCTRDVRGRGGCHRCRASGLGIDKGMEDAGTNVLCFFITLEVEGGVGATDAGLAG